MPTPIRNCINHSAELAVNMSVLAAVGYCCARVFTRINPVHGAVFAASSCLTANLINPIFNKIFASEDSNEASKFFGNVLTIGTGIAASAALSTALGFPMTFSAGLVLAMCIPVAIFAIRLFSAFTYKYTVA